MYLKISHQIMMFLQHLKEDMKLSYLAQELISTDRLAPQSWYFIVECLFLISYVLLVMTEISEMRNYVGVQWETVIACKKTMRLH